MPNSYLHCEVRWWQCCCCCAEYNNNEEQKGACMQTARLPVFQFVLFLRIQQERKTAANRHTARGINGIDYMCVVITGNNLLSQQQTALASRLAYSSCLALFKLVCL